MPNLPRDTNGKLEQYAFPGGYEIFYLDQDNSVLCAKCANETENNGFDWDKITSAGLNYEDQNCFCDNCSTQIDAAYEGAE